MSSTNTDKPQVTEMFQVYNSTMATHRIITRNGKVLRVKNHKLVTSQLEEIKFLNEEIAAGFPYLTKGPMLTALELDPMASLRKRIIEEHEAAKATEVKSSPEAELALKLETAKIEADKLKTPIAPKSAATQHPQNVAALNALSTADLSAGTPAKAAPKITK